MRAELRSCGIDAGRDSDRDRRLAARTDGGRGLGGRAGLAARPLVALHPQRAAQQRAGGQRRRGSVPRRRGRRLNRHRTTGGAELIKTAAHHAHAC